MVQQYPNETGGLQLVSSLVGSRPLPITGAERVDASAVANRLPAVLQTTLDCSQLIQLFNQEIQPLLLQHSLQFSNQAQGIELLFGSPSHHRCQYRLEIDQQQLGELSLSRSKKFSEAEILLLEDLLCKLVYPLRNSLVYQQAVKASLSDSLTGLANRESFDRSLRREIELSRRQQSPLSLVVLDIDSFKGINDAYGHSSGDRALRLLADLLNATLRQTDMVFRYGGEEFTMLLSHTDCHGARLVAERLRAAASQLKCHDGIRSFGLTISLGIAELSAQDSAYSLFDRADSALYKAKSTGRNRMICACDQH